MDCKVILKIKGKNIDIERFFNSFWNEKKNKFSMYNFVTKDNFYDKTGTTYDIYKCNKNLYTVLTELKRKCRNKEKSIITIEYCSYVNPNIPFIILVSKVFDLKFEMFYYQKDIEFIGTIVIKDGKLLKEWIANSEYDNYYDFTVKLGFETVNSVLDNFDMTEEQKHILLTNNPVKNIIDVKKLL